MRAAPTPPDPYQAILHGIAEARVDDAAAARAKAHWLARQAEEGATLLGALRDLVEQRRPVRGALRGGHAVTGRLVRADAEQVVVRHPGGTTHVRTSALARVLLDPGTAPGGRDDVPTRRPQAAAEGDAVGVTPFSTVLRDAAAERADAVLLTDDGAELAGQLRAVGVDVATLRVGGGPAPQAGQAAAGTLLVALGTVVAVRFPHHR